MQNLLKLTCIVLWWSCANTIPWNVVPLATSQNCAGFMEHLRFLARPIIQLKFSL